MGQITPERTISTEHQPQRVNLAPHARAYTRKGWAIVPLWWVDRPEFIDPDTGEVSAGVCGCPKGDSCTSPGKHPHTRHGSKEPMRTGLEVDIYWARNPNCNVGVATGAVSGFIVLDIDPDKGGVESMRWLWTRYGGPADTPVSITGSGGRHVLYAHPGGKVKNAIGYKPGIDVRGDGGLIVAPPSLHVTGRRYYWHQDAHPRDHSPQEMPAWMMAFVEASETEKRKRNLTTYNGKSRVVGNAKYGRALDPDQIPAIGEGERNNTLCSIAGRLIWENRPEGEVLDMVQRINENRCSPPLPDREVERLVHHAYRRWAK